MNEFSKESVDKNNEANSIQKKIVLSVQHIFDQHMNSGNGQSKNDCDRISIMTYGKNVRKMFNLVSINKNKT